jgi:sialic acid synthase SpsE
VLREIAGRPVGGAAPLWVVAEIGLNHGGDEARALELVDAAAWAGASAIKLQTLEACSLVSSACPAPAHVSAGNLREFFSQFELSMASHRRIVSRARERGLAVMTTPFATHLIPELEAIRFDAYKVASGDLTYHGLIRALAGTGRPLVLSTGMSSLPEIHAALRVARDAGAREVALLHCVSAYPTPPSAQNLRAIETLRREFDVPVGLSDHSATSPVSLAAVALGASIYERHLVLHGDRTAIDREVSSTPLELRDFIRNASQVAAALGSGVKECQPAEAVNLTASRRGLYAAANLREGDVVTEAHVAVLRPAAAVGPELLPSLIGTVMSRDLAAGEAFAARDLR